MNIFNKILVQSFFRPGPQAQPPGLVTSLSQDRSITRDTALGRFFGQKRMAFADSILTQANSGSPAAKVVLGTRRAGKTALTNYILARNTERGGGVSVLGLNGQAAVSSVYSESEKKRAEALYDSIVNGGVLDSFDRERFFGDLRATPPADLKLTFWKRIEEISKKGPVLLLFDEPSAFFNADSSFFRSWRALYDRGSNVSIVFTAFTEALGAALEEHRGAAESGSYSASLNVAETVGLAPFTAEDCAQMLGSRLFAKAEYPFSAGFSEFVRILSGGNSYLIDAFAHLLHRAFTKTSSSGRAFDPSIFTEEKLQAPDYFLLLPALVSQVLLSMNAVMKPFRASWYSDALGVRSGHRSSGGDSLETVTYLGVGEFFNAVVRQVILSGSLDFEVGRFFHPSEEQRVGIGRGENQRSLEFLLEYLESVGIFTSQYDEEGRKGLRLSQFPFFAAGGSSMFTPSDANVYPSSGLKELFEQYPHHQLSADGVFEGGRMTFRLDTNRTLQMEDDVQHPSSLSVRISPVQLAAFWFFLQSSI